MTNGEKFKEIFQISQIDEGELYAYVWLPNHDAAEISIDWWNAEYKEPTTKNDLGVDAVSRKAVLNQIFYSTDNSGDVVLGSALRERIERLPSVTPQEPKTGHWIPTYGNVKCSVCGSVKDSRDVGNATHYCDFCGAKMVEPQESEVDNGNDDR